MAKKGQIQKRYSTEFKIGVIIDMREHRGYTTNHKTVLKLMKSLNLRGKQSTNTIPTKERLAK